MKFVKQHSWEQEWADTLRQEKAYLQKNLHKKDSASTERWKSASRTPCRTRWTTPFLRLSR